MEAESGNPLNITVQVEQGEQKFSYSNVAPNRKNRALGMWSQVGKENLTY